MVLALTTTAENVDIVFIQDTTLSSTPWSGCLRSLTMGEVNRLSTRPFKLALMSCIVQPDSQITILMPCAAKDSQYPSIVDTTGSGCQVTTEDSRHGLTIGPR